MSICTTYDLFCSRCAQWVHPDGRKGAKAIRKWANKRGWCCKLNGHEDLCPDCAKADLEAYRKTLPSRDNGGIK